MVTKPWSSAPVLSSAYLVQLKVVLDIECILKVQVPGVSMRPLPCTDADHLLRCSATVGNLHVGERGEPDIFTKVRHWDILHVLKDRTNHTGPLF